MPSSIKTHWFDHNGRNEDKFSLKMCKNIGLLLSLPIPERNLNLILDVQFHTLQIAYKS